MLKTYELCPKKFEFKYIKNINMPVNDEIFETGKNIHALASYYLRGQNIDKMEAALNNKERLLWDYLKSLEYMKLEVINTEYNLSANIGNCYYGGRLDALLKDGESYTILDYKTGSAPKNAKYDYQTMIYLLCVNSLFKTENITFIYLDLKNKTETSVKLDGTLIKEYTEKLSQITSKIEKGIFPPVKDNTVCSSCENKVICYH